MKRAAIWTWFAERWIWLGVVCSAVLGLGIVAAVIYGFGELCTNSLVICKGAEKSPPWTLLSGVAAAPALLLTWYWRTKHRTEELKQRGEQLKQRDEELKHRTKELSITEDRQTGERYARAVELLGSDKANVRLGGVYALEKLAKSEEHHGSCLKTLSAYFRDGVAAWRKEEGAKASQPPEASKKTEEDAKPKPKDLPIDLLAAFTVALQVRDKTEERVDFSGVDLHEVRLKRCSLQGADLQGADLHGADLGYADLQDADLRFADLQDAEMKFANLQKVNLQHAKLQDADLLYAKLQKANLQHAKLQDASLFSANLQHATLGGAVEPLEPLGNIGLQILNLVTDLQDAKLQYAEMQHANLEGVNLKGANLQHAKLQGANLQDANLEGANLQDANLEGASLQDANLEGASLAGAKLQDASLEGAEGANLAGTVGTPKNRT